MIFSAFFLSQIFIFYQKQQKLDQQHSHSVSLPSASVAIRNNSLLSLSVSIISAAHYKYSETPFTKIQFVLYSNQVGSSHSHNRSLSSASKIEIPHADHRTRHFILLSLAPKPVCEGLTSSNPSRQSIGVSIAQTPHI